MKRLIVSALLLALVLFAAPASAQLCQVTLSGAIVTGVAGPDGNSSADPSVVTALSIPAVTTGFADDFFATYSSLKYIRLEHSDSKSISFDLSGAENLEAVYLHFPPTDTVKNKLQVSVPVLQYVSLSDKTIRFAQNNPTFKNGSVLFSFSNIVADGYPGYSYTVTRTQKDTDSQSVFDFDHHFSTSNGAVTFTDNDVLPGKTYAYTIAAHEPFKSTVQASAGSVAIPPEPGFLLPDSGWSGDSIKESFHPADLSAGNPAGSFRLRLSPIADERLAGEIRNLPIPQKLLDFTPTNAAAIDLTPQFKEHPNSVWKDHTGDISLSTSLPLDKLIPEGRTIRYFTVLHLDQTVNVWDNDLGYALMLNDVETDASPQSPLTVSKDHSVFLSLSHFSPFVILWEEIDPAVLAAIETLPDTGDRAPLAAWLLLLGASALLLRRKHARA